VEQSGVHTGFFEQKLPSRIILLSFPLLTIPVAAALTFTTDHRFLFFYIWLFGITHFVLTLSVYLQSENLKHFAENGRNILLFFAIPLAILMGFYVIGVLQLRAKFPAFAVIFGAAIRLLDFNHLNRQSFGVYQMFKARTGIRPATVQKRVEQAYVVTLTLLLFATFLAGGAYPLLRGNASSVSDAAHGRLGPALLPIGLLQAVCVALSSLLLIFGATSVRLLLRSWRSAGRPAGLAQALSYLAFQTAGALLAVISMPLYFATLAIHYVEYHVLMYPRCFHTALHEQSALDRCFGRLRRSPPVFYGVTAIAALVVLVFTNSSGMADSSTRYLSVVSIFDGLFVFHYFVETLIWRFSDPFFRRTLTSLYFVPRLRTAPTEATCGLGINTP
jgi:hypothetical protein